MKAIAASLQKQQETCRNTPPRGKRGPRHTITMIAIITDGISHRPSHGQPDPEAENPAHESLGRIDHNETVVLNDDFREKAYNLDSNPSVLIESCAFTSETASNIAATVAKNHTKEN